MIAAGCGDNTRMRILLFAPIVVWALLAGAATGQAGGEATGAELLARVRAGGWLDDAKYRREADGTLAIWSTAHTGDPERGEFQPVFAPVGDAANGEAASVLDVLGPSVLTLVCHGDADLLAMTDSAFHFGALGIGDSDVALRQFLALPPPSFDGQRGRAELLDRLLAIDRLEHRGCRAAIGELTMLRKDAALPPALRERAARALQRLGGGAPSLERRRLDPASLALPATADVYVLVEHARLPSLRWITPHWRRMGALVTATAIAGAGGTVAQAQCNAAQRMCDAVAEAPFWLVHRCGNARLDRSLLAIVLGGRESLQVTWNAAGEFEAERWRRGLLPEGAAADAPLLGGALALTPSTLLLRTAPSTGDAPPEVAAQLLAELSAGGDGAAALCAVVPAESALWSHAMGLPRARRVVARLRFGEPAVLTVVATNDDEAAAAAWLARTKELLGQLEALRECMVPAIAEQPGLRALVDALAATELRVVGRDVHATATIAGCTPARIAALLDAVAVAEAEGEPLVRPPR